MNQGLIKTYLADAPIEGSRIVKAGSADGHVAMASNLNDPILGISDLLGNRPDMRVDVVHSQITDLKLGGNVSYGARLTTDANGQGIQIVASNAGASVVGKALQSGINGDIIPVLITLA